MTRLRSAIASICAAVLIGMTSAACAQYACNAPTTNSWLTPVDGGQQGKFLAASCIAVVQTNLEAAVAMLETQSAIPLDNAGVAALTGLQPGDAAQNGLKPFLVRAVYPVRQPRLELRWIGARLDVSASGLGCARFVKHPLVVWLEQLPYEVHVHASAAL